MLVRTHQPTLSLWRSEVDVASLVVAVVSAIAGIVSAVVAIAQYRLSRLRTAPNANVKPKKERRETTVEQDENWMVVVAYGGSLTVFGLLSAIVGNPDGLAYLMLIYVIGILVSIGACFEERKRWRQAKRANRHERIRAQPFIFLLEGVATLGLSIIFTILMQ
jgi:hypothetical protein